METAEQLETRKNELMSKLQATLDKAKVTCDRLEEKAVAAAKAADQSIHEHPYTALSVAFGVGVVVGILAMSAARRD
jgi:ElaB/YqjD/DUF883 family membrane-anchored ribosome-binding protein